MSTSPRITETRLPAHLNPANWFIGVGTLLFAGLAWFGFGQPGMPLKDGYYNCEPATLQIPSPMGAVVENGQVASVSGSAAREHFDGPVRWSDATRTSAREFRVTVDDALKYYICKYDGSYRQEAASRSFLEAQKEIAVPDAGEAPVKNDEKPGYAQDGVAVPGDTSSPRDPGRYSSPQEIWNTGKWTRATLCFGDPEDHWDSWKDSVRNFGRQEFVAFVEAKCEGPWGD